MLSFDELQELGGEAWADPFDTLHSAKNPLDDMAIDDPLVWDDGDILHAWDDVDIFDDLSSELYNFGAQQDDLANSKYVL